MSNEKNVTHNLDINMYSFKDILNLFNLNDTFNIEDLGRAKKKVLMLHPDKSKLPSEYFIFYKKAYEIFLDLYENDNDPRAAYAIGEYYDNHWVFWPNYKKAFKYYLFAAERGVPEAQYNVANMYEFGDGVKKDLVQSVRWYLQCNKSSLCGAGKEGIDDLIAELSSDELDYALSLVEDTIEEVDIRITAARSIVVQ